jgi:hypothetical protein
MKILRQLSICASLTALIIVATSTGSARELTGCVLIAGQPVAGATVTLYAAGPAEPARLAESKTDDHGGFEPNTGQPTGETQLYVVAKGGTPKAAASKSTNDAIALLALLGSTSPRCINVNEFTTVASAFTAARFINGESISGNPLGLRIAAGNVPNLVDPATGEWGKVLLDPINSTQTATLPQWRGSHRN